MFTKVQKWSTFVLISGVAVACSDDMAEVLDTPDRECTASVDCTDSAKPLCRDGVCVADDSSDKDQAGRCTRDEDCSGALPVCDKGVCVAKPANKPGECTNDTDCGDGKVCKSGVCENANPPVTEPPVTDVECNEAKDCASGMICESNKCVPDHVVEPPESECTIDSDCVAGLVCSDGKCVKGTTPTEPEKHDYVADLLDVVFNDDGSAKNLAPTDLVVKSEGTKPSIQYNDVMKRNIAQFANTAGGKPTSYYRVDFGDSPDVMRRIADGHTLEIVLNAGNLNSGAGAIHPFSATESGGTGILVSDQSSGKTITYLPHIGGAYASTNSGVTPKKGTYYHVVGVYDKAAGQASIYVNGELKKSVAVSGEFKFGTETWFGIGADAYPGGGEAAWNGSIGIVRIYDDALSSDRVKALYDESAIAEIVEPPVVTPPASDEPINLSGVDAMGTLRLSVGYHYYIYGKGFLAGDMVRFESTTGGNTYDCVTSVEDGRIVAVIPDDFVTDTYRSVLVRGDRTQNLASGKLTVLKWAPRTTHPKIVAHMGAWSSDKSVGRPANSRAAIREALRLHVYGIELDTNYTKDGGVFLGHGNDSNSYYGVVLHTNDSATVAKIQLSNGEMIPTYEDAVKLVVEEEPRVRLLLHHKWDVLQSKLDKCLAVNEKYGYTENVDHMMDSSYSDAVTAAKKVPEHSVAMTLTTSTGGNRLTASKLSEDKVWPNFNYTTSWLDKTYVDGIHAQGMTIGAWTVPNSAYDSVKNKGIDFITTDDVAAMMKKVKVYCEPAEWAE